MGIPADELQVLTPTRRGDAGTRSLNFALQAALNPPKPGKQERRFGELVFREGDRVMNCLARLLTSSLGEDGTAGAGGIFSSDVITADPQRSTRAENFWRSSSTTAPRPTVDAPRRAHFLPPP